MIAAGQLLPVQKSGPKRKDEDVFKQAAQKYLPKFRQEVQAANEQVSPAIKRANAKKAKAKPTAKTKTKRA